MKVSKSTVNWASVQEVELPSSKPSILSELENVMGEKEVVQVSMSWSEWGAIRRHLKASEKKSLKPRFLAKLVSFRGNNKDRVYEVVIKRNND